MFDTFNASVTRTVLGAIGTTLCAGVCLVAAAGPADAAPAASARTATVRYADLDLSRPAGRATLDRRIATAAQTVCATSDTGLDAALAEQACFHRAVAAARAKVAASATL